MNNRIRAGLKVSFIAAMSMNIIGCGGDSGASGKVVKEHFFDQPYECTREKELTSKKTGKTRIAKYLSHYSPEKGWRVDLWNVGSSGGLRVANLYTADARYDGSYKERDGVITKVNFMTAWPYKEVKPNAALSLLSKTNKKDCRLMTDLSVFDIDYLSTLEVMGQ